MTRRTALPAASLLLLASAVCARAAEHPVTWPEEQRAFWSEGGLLLLGEERRQQLRDADVEGRRELLADWLADPDPSTEANEVRAAIDARIRLARSAYPSPADDRFKLLFLHGEPTVREVVDCGRAFQPLEIWRYGAEGQQLVLFQPALDPAFRLWMPNMGKKPLYTDEMGYWLEQYHELRHAISGRRFDLQLCREARKVDDATGIRGLVEYREERPRNGDIERWLQPPEEIAAWARSVGAAAVPGGEALRVSDVEVGFPERQDLMMRTAFLIRVPRSAVEPFESSDTGAREARISVDGEVERFAEGDDDPYGEWFEDFRVRFQAPLRESAGESGGDGDGVDAEAAADAAVLPLLVERSYRPGERLIVRMRVRDEVSGRSVMVARSFEVPRRAQPFDIPVSEEVLAAMDAQRATEKIRGEDSILLIPPATDLVFGLWRAEAIVTGEGIERVAFLVDGAPQFERTRPPFTAELRLARYPEEQIIRVEGLDAEGEVVASDEIILNQQRGALRVRITEPQRGATPPGTTTASAQVVVPEERRLESVEFQVNNERQALVEAPPWRAEITVPERRSEQDITYLTVIATLDDGSRAEEVRFLNVPDYLDTVDVDLVELYTTVTDGSRLILDAEQDDFTVLEDGRPQELVRFELVQDRPLTIGITIDTSGSMIESLGEARQAAVDFLENVVTQRDQTFALAFADRPELLMPRTSDVGAVAETLARIGAQGNTALNDAIVTSLYYFRGVRGRRALVLLSDGEDTASRLEFPETLEYARRSGVLVYTIGLRIGRMQLGVRNHLNELAQETGGRSFYIDRAEELRDVYEQIERDLRSQYLLAYQSDRPATLDDGFREVEVKVDGGRSARTIRGYYP